MFFIEMKKGSKMTEEQRQRLSDAHKGKSAWWNKGRHHTEETKKKISEANKGKDHWTGRHHTLETKEKLKKSHQGPKPWLQGKKLSEEHKKKLSEIRKKLFEDGKMTAWNKGKKMNKPSWMKGKNHTPEANEKNRLAHLGKPAWNKDKKTGIIPWNKGKIGTLHHTEEVKARIREFRLKQIFPLRDSTPEIKIQNFLKQLNLKFLAHRPMREIENSYQSDIFIPSINLVIEIDGDYWHGNTDNPRFKILNQKQINTKEKDAIRTKELQERGFKVLRLWESDIKKMDVNNFKERIKEFNKILIK